MDLDYGDQAAEVDENREDDDVDDDYQDKEKVNKTDLIKRVAQCILASATRRGYCRDVDIAEMFMNKKERELRDTILKKVQKELKTIFGFRMERDEESKRFYIYNDLKKNIGMKLAEIMDKHGESLYGPDDYDEIDNQEYLEDPNFKRWLLTIVLMFIFMSRRHTEINNQTEKGVDLLLIKKFLERMFNEFNMAPLKDKEFGELFGPAKSAEFIAEGWLRYYHERVAGNEETYYLWDSRAEKIINKQQMLDEFCKIYGSTIHDWPNHARMAGYRI